ncbi:hypothetical protein [Pelagibaculum spongiae]|uniref:Uncharacterized protein n=1 Tax=Pelagibaculum spongiae TaxID=2080658 RepID=A0A2V1GUH1_9GAMM|nr:hypothetical protein [Pelagibaculum spongiae]PVZ69659.1 hypothetical protein DC094_10175 [Pelagibaculum spongiae]
MCISAEAVEWMCASWIELDYQQLEQAIQASFIVPIAANSKIFQREKMTIQTTSQPANDYSAQLEVALKKSA